MRWEDLREGHDGQALFDREDIAPAPERGTGRAGLGAPGGGPVDGGDGEPVAVEIRARSIINRVPGESPMFRWTLNPYRGCAHACVYCFARGSHTYLDLDAGRDFDPKIMVKVNAGELLRAELARPSWQGEPIAMGTNTDPYQRAEGRYRLMPQIISALRDAANPFSVLTKGRLILRDADLLEQAARVTDVRLAVSVGAVDEPLARSVEPGAPTPRARLDTVRALADRGLGCSVLMAPVLPGLTDSPEAIDAAVSAIAGAGAGSVTPIVLHLRPGGAREWYAAWLAREHPHLVPLYRDLYGKGSYAPAPYREQVAARVREAARRYGIGGRAGGGRSSKEGAPADGHRPPTTPHRGAEAEAPRQMRLL